MKYKEHSCREVKGNSSGKNTGNMRFYVLYYFNDCKGMRFNMYAQDNQKYSSWGTWNNAAWGDTTD